MHTEHVPKAPLKMKRRAWKLWLRHLHCASFSVCSLLPRCARGALPLSSGWRLCCAAAAILNSWCCTRGVAFQLCIMSTRGVSLRGMLLLQNVFPVHPLLSAYSFCRAAAAALKHCRCCRCASCLFGSAKSIGGIRLRGMLLLLPAAWSAWRQHWSARTAGLPKEACVLALDRLQQGCRRLSIPHHMDGPNLQSHRESLFSCICLRHGTSDSTVQCR